MSVHLILYSKPGCHLCEGLQEKLMQIESLDLNLDVRDITTRDDWFQAYQYEIPVLMLVREEAKGDEAEGRRQEAGGVEGAEKVGEAELNQNLKLETQNSKLHPSSPIPLPRPSPRATVQQLEQMLRKYL